MTRRALGVDIGGSGIKAAPVDLDTGELLGERFRLPTPQPSTPDAVVDALGAVLEHLGWDGPFGATFPGVVQGGTARTAANVDPAWVGTDVAALFAERQPMRADNTAPLIAAARSRHELTRAKAIRALRELDRAGPPISFEAVARHVAVSRSWLYTQPDCAAEIARLRDATGRAPTAGVPAAQRTSDASLLRRLQAAQARNRQLSEDNQ